MIEMRTNALLSQVNIVLKLFKYFYYIILGESGSGKTEAARIVLQFLVLVSGNIPEVKLMKDRLVQANTLLEAFGNARTMRNDNASRFVRYINNK
jgi:myosin-1